MDDLDEVLKSDSEDLNSNASASALGWQFQYNAAIVLMLDFITDANSIRVEGKSQDIEITLNDGMKIYSQSKATSKDDFAKEPTKVLKKALESLSKSNRNNDCKQLIYVTNIVEPLGKNSTKYDFQSGMHMYYADMGLKSKKVIDKIIEKNGYEIDVNKFSVKIIPFNGMNQETKFFNIKKRIDEFISSLKYPINPYTLDTLKHWQFLLSDNSTNPNISIDVSKKKFIWILIAQMLEYVEDKTKDLDHADKALIINKYRDIINTSTERYDLSTKVVFDFYSNSQKYQKSEDFVDETWENYTSDFDTPSLSEEIREKLVKIILNAILNQRYFIDNVKRAVNL